MSKQTRKGVRQPKRPRDRAEPRAQPTPAGAVPVNPALLAPSNSYGAPPWLMRGYYEDIPFTCRGCGAKEIWRASQQRWWYEVARGNIESGAVECRACRRKARHAREKAGNWRRHGDVVVARLAAQDVRAASRLVAAGLAERFGSYDATRNPDLTDFRAHYVDGGESAAFVAAAKRRNTLVGCGVLLRETATRARILRMSVAASERRTGIGRVLLFFLVDNARRLRYREIVLETTSSWTDAVEFYRALGFRVVEQRDGDTHFRMLLT